MQFHVPQFIEVEDKIFGPFTFKQFIYLGGGLGFCLILYSFFPLIVVIILGAPVVALSVALAFYKINNRPFVNIVEAGFKYFTGSQKYIWKKEPRKITAEDSAKKEEPDSTLFYVPKLSNSKLKDIAWSLDVHEDARRGRGGNEET